MPRAAKRHSTLTTTVRAAPYSTSNLTASPLTAVATPYRHGRPTPRFNNTSSAGPTTHTMSSHTTSSHPTRNKNTTWDTEADRRLMEARAQGQNWTPIAHNLFPDKTPNACRKRHERLIVQRRQTQDWDGVKLEQLAMAYTEVREQMWTLLANRLGGERWQTVEAKVMEKGPKNLQVVNNSVTRRRRAPSTQDQGDDSGLVLFDTPSHNGDDDQPSSQNERPPKLQQGASPLQFPERHPMQPPQPTPYVPPHSSISHQRGTSFPTSSSSASSTTTSPTFTAPISRNWSMSSPNMPAPSTLIPRFSPSPQLAQPPAVTYNSGNVGNYGQAPGSSGPTLPALASIMGPPGMTTI